MNYLAHAYLSNNDFEIMFGNLIGDFVKGANYQINFTDRINLGIKLHRFIDEITDKHPAHRRLKPIFSKDYGLFSGIILDVVMDYFLANDPQAFNSTEDLKDFSLKVYEYIDISAKYIPEKSTKFFHYLKAENWLYEIRTLKGLRKALQRLEKKAPRIGDTTKAFEVTVQHYYELNQGYFELIHDLENNVNDFLNNYN